MPPASESNGANRKVEDAKTSLIGWAVGVITTAAIFISGYALNGVSALEKKNAVVEEKQAALANSLNEIKTEQKDMRREQIQMARILDRVSDAVGAKKP